MGNFFNKSNRRLDSIFMEGFDEEDESLLIFNQPLHIDRTKLVKSIQELSNKIRELISENQSLHQELNNYKNSTNNELYQINEKMNLVNKDLQALLTNDKILLQEYNKLKDRNSTSLLEEN